MVAMRPLLKSRGLVNFLNMTFAASLLLFVFCIAYFGLKPSLKTILVLVFCMNSSLLDRISIAASLSVLSILFFLSMFIFYLIGTKRCSSDFSSSSEVEESETFGRSNILPRGEEPYIVFRFIGKIKGSVFSSKWICFCKLKSSD